MLALQTIEAGTAAMASPRIVCRPIGETDLDAAVRCLARGFPERSVAYWRRAFLRLRERAVPPGRPRYGHLMTASGEVVGLVLVIYAVTDAGSVRANVSSWFVEPDYRGYSGMLLASAFRARDVTFINISPSPTTLETIAAQGFSRYVGGTFHAVAALSRHVPGACVSEVTVDTPAALPLLAEHAACGCLCLKVRLGDAAHPFVFVPMRNLRNLMPSAQLVYCRDVAEFVRFAGPLGRRLARLGIPTIMVDANGPVPGLVGRYVEGRRIKFFRGPAPPRLGDLSSTELVYLGP